MAPHDAPSDPVKDFEAWVIHTRLAQGLPARVEDIAVLARLADLLCNHQEVSHPGGRTEADASAGVSTAEEDTVITESSDSTTGMNSRSQLHQRQRRVVVWGCKEHQTPAGEECQG